jgi:hypothetical protein
MKLDAIWFLGHFSILYFVFKWVLQNLKLRTKTNFCNFVSSKNRKVHAFQIPQTNQKPEKKNQVKYLFPSIFEGKNTLDAILKFLKISKKWAKKSTLSLKTFFCYILYSNERFKSEDFIWLVFKMAEILSVWW